jgi:hypothetical protein
LALLLLSLAPSPGRTVRRIELRGNSRILSTDAPMRKGRVYLFHRYPDGVYMSVAVEDVLGIAVTTVGERPRLPDTVLLGPTGEGQPSEPTAQAPSPVYEEEYPGYYGDCYGCYGPPAPPPRPGRLPPALVGPNGFPLLPGSPPPPPIGPNGFPILAPSPPPSRR